MSNDDYINSKLLEASNFTMHFHPQTHKSNGEGACDRLGFRKPFVYMRIDSKSDLAHYKKTGRITMAYDFQDTFPISMSLDDGFDNIMQTEKGSDLHDDTFMIVHTFSMHGSYKEPISYESFLMNVLSDLKKYKNMLSSAAKAAIMKLLSPLIKSVSKYFDFIGDVVEFPIKAAEILGEWLNKAYDLAGDALNAVKNYLNEQFPDFMKALETIGELPDKIYEELGKIKGAINEGLQSLLAQFGITIGDDVLGDAFDILIDLACLNKIGIILKPIEGIIGIIKDPGKYIPNPVPDPKNLIPDPIGEVPPLLGYVGDFIDIGVPDGSTDKQFQKAFDATLDKNFDIMLDIIDAEVKNRG